jgi:transcriptional regulator with XRE-family HTH domain
MTPKTSKKIDYERLVAQETLILEATETIVDLLEQQRMTRQELAARLGKSKGFVSQLLSGERNMTLRTLADLGYVLGQRFALTTYASEEDRQLGEGEHGRHADDEKPADQESRADTPVEAVEEWKHAPGGADAHEYALAA